MSKLRKLVEETPRLAKVKDADRFSKRNLMVFDVELEDSESVFAFREEDGKGDRLSVLTIPGEYINNKEGYDSAMNRMKIAMLSQDRSKNRLTKEGEEDLDTLISVSKSKLESGDDNELTVEEIYPLEDAVRGIWF